MIRVAIGLATSLLGNVNYIRNLVSAIQARPHRTIEPLLLVGQHDAAPPTGFASVEVIRTGWLDPLTPGWGLRKLWQQTLGADPFLERILRSARVDVLSHADFLGRQADIPSVCWIGDFQHRRLPRYFSLQERLYRDHDLRAQCRHAARIVVSSDDAMSELARFEPSCVERARVLRFVAQPRVDKETPSRSDLEARYGFSGPYLLVPNQFWAHKNHALIIDALALLKTRHEDMLVLATGATEDYRQPGYFGDLMVRAERLGVRDRFLTLGVVPYADVVALMLHAVALLNPSRSEGWSTSVEEAKSLGKRIIMSDLAVHREQAPPGGLYVAADDSEGLAEAMSMIWREFDPVADRARIELAQAELPSRVWAFGDAYERIVLEAVAERRAR